MSEPAVACLQCGAESPPGAAFCPHCGTALVGEQEVTTEPVGDDPALGPPALYDQARDVQESEAPDRPEDPDATRSVNLAPVGETIGLYAEQKLGRAMQRLRRLAPPAVRIDNRPAGIIAAMCGLLTVVATFLTWIEIDIDGRAGPGSLASGLAGRDGLTVLVVGALAAAVGVLLLFGRGDGWLKMALFVTGGITTIIAIVDVTDAQSKADALERRFGIPEGIVTARVGIGLWLVLATGVALLAAGIIARRAESGSPAGAAEASAVATATAAPAVADHPNVG